MTLKVIFFGKNKIFHPDLNLLAPKNLIGDYQSPEIPKGARLNTDGTWEYKK